MAQQSASVDHRHLCGRLPRRPGRCPRCLIGSSRREERDAPENHRQMANGSGVTATLPFGKARQALSSRRCSECNSCRDPDRGRDWIRRLSVRLGRGRPRAPYRLAGHYHLRFPRRSGREPWSQDSPRAWPYGVSRPSSLQLWPAHPMRQWRRLAAAKLAMLGSRMTA